jgi:hypothetical protein
MSQLLSQEHSSRSGSQRRLAAVAAAGRSQLPSVALACGVAFAGTLIVALLQGEKPFWGDSGGYWSLAGTFTENGHFSLLNFNSPLRGYLLPLINYGLQRLQADFAWTSSSTVKVFNALVFALIGTVLGPALIRTVWPRQPRWRLWQRLALTALFVVFWSGYLNFPLSDFPGLAMALLTLVAVSRSDRPGWMLLAGVALGMCIDIRAAYLLLAPAVAVLVLWAWLEQRGSAHAPASRRALCAGLLVLGFAVVSLPQSLSAHRFYGTWSFVPSAASFEPAGSFFTPGMYNQNRDTYLKPGGAVAMIYEYPAGRRLLDEQKEDKILSTGQYVGLFFSHPLVMGGLIAGHIIDSMDPLYSTPYIEHLHNAGRTWGRIASYLLIFIALLRLLWPAARRRLGPARLRYLGALAVCVLTTVPSDIERRYFLPLYLIGYALALIPGWPNPLGNAAGGLRRYRTPAIIAVCFLAYTAVVWYFTGEALSHVRFES